MMMTIRSLSELQTPDERTLRFTPYGLGLDRALTPEAAAEYQQAIMAACALAPDVAEDTRLAFDRVRDLYAHGLFSYELFTTAHDQALFILEQALRARFVAFYDGAAVTLLGPGNTRHVVTVDHDEQVLELARRQRGSKLCITSGHAPIPFNGQLQGLHTWARSVRLLRGQRNRTIERALCTLRNTAAHPNGYSLLTPVDAALTISDVAEFINQLWGRPTTGGRLYPAPLERIVAVLSRNEQQFALTPAEAFLHQEEYDARGWRHAVIRCVEGDPDLCLFDSRYESTRFPTQVLHGPADKAHTLAWLRKHAPAGDTCEILDRTFFVRVTGTTMYRPVGEETARRLPESQRHGHWYAITADTPGDALNHVRHVVSTSERTRSDTPCSQCPATTLGHGTHANIVGATTSTRSSTVVVRTPWAQPWPSPASL
ncbi:hypothetical protein ACWDLG_39720 [Nonomuraea sp. NPDC003727]